MNPFRRRRLIRPVGDGRFRFELPEDVLVMVADFADQLATMLESDDPALRRLFPSPYPTDPDLDASYQILARSELTDERRAEIEVVRRSVEADDVSRDELASWMRVTNDLRLVLGTRLDVSEDDDPEDEMSPAHEVYGLLGLLLDEIVDALSRDLD